MADHAPVESTDAGPGHPGLAGVASRVVALGRELDGLRRMQETQRSRLGELGRRGDELVDTVGPLADRLRRVDQLLSGLAATVAGLGEELAEHVQHLADDEQRDRRLSWFDIDDQDAAVERLVDLANWLERVHVHYPDGGLPSCWMWHPAVVEELLWLRRAWEQAFHGPSASVLRVADWHERHRPGVVRRIAELEYGTCSLSRHRRGDDQDTPPPRAPLGRGPDADTARAAVAAWWAGDRSGPAPDPTPDQLAAAGALQ